MEIGIKESESTSVPIKDEPNVLGKKLLSHSPWLPSCCIFRVPEVIRRQKEDAYEPNIVSIGPIHRGNRDKKFKFLEDVKRWYLHCLLSTCPYISLESLIKVITELGKSARDCYADPLDDLNEKDFVEMMILDGCFLLQLFRKAYFCMQEDYDPVFDVPCMWEHLYHDLLLLENQLPWFVLDCLNKLTANSVSQRSASQRSASLTSLVLNFFTQSEADVRLLNMKSTPEDEILHILDLVRAAIVDGYIPETSNDLETSNELVQNQQTKKELKLPQRIPNATALSKAGIKFKNIKKEGECIMNIKFEKGSFKIPELGIDERTGPLFRNLIAFEQCHSRPQHKITSYAVLIYG